MITRDKIENFTAQPYPLWAYAHGDVARVIGWTMVNGSACPVVFDPLEGSAAWQHGPGTIVILFDTEAEAIAEHEADMVNRRTTQAAAEL